MPRQKGGINQDITPEIAPAMALQLSITSLVICDPRACMAV
jgi:hypothetical protein